MEDSPGSQFRSLNFYGKIKKKVNVRKILLTNFDSFANTNNTAFNFVPGAF